MKENDTEVKKQIMYLGRWVDREHFRAFVYKTGGEKKLAGSYDEFKTLISSGVWFDSIENVPRNEPKSLRKSKHDSANSNS